MSRVDCRPFVCPRGICLAEKWRELDQWNQVQDTLCKKGKYFIKKCEGSEITVEPLYQDTSINMTSLSVHKTTLVYLKPKLRIFR